MSTNSVYDQLIIYYFSGTGNAKKSAEWMAEIGRNAKIDSHLINIDRFKTVKVPPIKGRVLIGFCTPTHGFNIPPIMIQFILAFPKIKNASVFLLNTRGGLKMYKLFLPGLSGIAQFFPALILLRKGFRIVGMQPVDLPSNWLILHPGLRDKVVLSIYSRWERKVKDFARILLAGGNKYWPAFWSLPIDILIAPISLGYYFVGRYFLAKTLIATDKCDSCKRCVENCPVEAIIWVDDRPFWTFDCESCMRCVNSCPERAIETAHSFAAFMIYLSIIGFSSLISAFMVKINFMGLSRDSLLYKSIDFTLFSAGIVIMMYAGYRLFHYLMRFKAINRLIAYTSLSKYKYWRRYQPKKIRRKSNVKK